MPVSSYGSLHNSGDLVPLKGQLMQLFSLAFMFLILNGIQKVQIMFSFKNGDRVTPKICEKGPGGK